MGQVKKEYIKSLITGLKKDLKHIDDSVRNIKKDCEKYASQFRGVYKKHAYDIVWTKAQKDIDKLKLKIIGELMNLKMTLAINYGENADSHNETDEKKDSH